MFMLGKKRVHIFVLVVAVTVIALLVGLAGHQGRAVTPGGAATALAAGTNSLEGVWYVMAEGAPFQPHLFTFHSDGTMLTHNPETADPTGSDSAGMGPWKRLGEKRVPRPLCPDQRLLVRLQAAEQSSAQVQRRPGGGFHRHGDRRHVRGSGFRELLQRFSGAS